MYYFTFGSRLGVLGMAAANPQTNHNNNNVIN